ncbi:MAG TPA: hypothetical protein VHE55_13155 [Fimbriimonadaceae bacterium]|nr:hypothetical protein [Fimbriimonadaceae bacterium]
MIKKITILALACVGMAGCMPHFKELDSYNTNFRNDEIQSMPGKGDPYTFGGIAEGSGGTYARQSYATDNPTMDARDDTASLGEIAKNRTSTPGGLPGETGTLPGAGPAVVLLGSTEPIRTPAASSAATSTAPPSQKPASGGISGGG